MVSFKTTLHCHMLGEHSGNLALKMGTLSWDTVEDPTRPNIVPRAVPPGACRLGTQGV